jgi:hypothetical protein
MQSRAGLKVLPANMKTAWRLPPMRHRNLQWNAGAEYRIYNRKEIGMQDLKLFADGTGDILIAADEIFSDPGKYFVINLERKDKYDAGHIRAVRYKPESTWALLT